jgi:two-component system response regulator NreC
LSKLRILLADDHVVVRDGLKALVNAQPDMEVIGEAKDGRDAWHKIVELLPDVAVVDVSMPDLNGIQATEKVKRECPQVKVLALTAYKDKGYLDQLLKVGASGYILKSSAAEDLLKAIHDVSVGRIYVDREMTDEITDSYVRRQGPHGSTRHKDLTDREEQILRSIAQGYGNKEIAAQLNISVKTVESHKANLMAKLDFRSRAEVVRYAVRQGWLHDN